MRSRLTARHVASISLGESRPCNDFILYTEMILRMHPIAAAAPQVAAAPAWRHRRQPPARHFFRRLCRAAAAGTPSGGDNTDSSDLLRRAQQLQEARRQLAEEAAALAAAEGLSAAERAALLEVIGLPEPPGWQQAQDAEGERQAPQQATLPDTQPLAAGTQDAGGEPALPGSPAWRAELPPHLQSFLLDTGLASVLDEQAEAVRKDREWAAAEEHGGAWVRGGGAPQARGQGHGARGRQRLSGTALPMQGRALACKALLNQSVPNAWEDAHPVLALKHCMPAGGDMEAVARMLEEGRDLPPLPGDTVRVDRCPDAGARSMQGGGLARRRTLAGTLPLEANARRGPRSTPHGGGRSVSILAEAASIRLAPNLSASCAILARMRGLGL